MEIKEKIREAGLRVTPQRLLVYSAAKELCHATIDDIIEQIEQTNPEVTLSTIYRILNSFYECNLLAKVTHPNGKVFYDINVHEHCHKIAQNQELSDIDDPELIRLIEQRVSSQIGSNERIDKISIQITTTINATI